MTIIIIFTHSLIFLVIHSEILCYSFEKSICLFNLPSISIVHFSIFTRSDCCCILCISRNFPAKKQIQPRIKAEANLPTSCSLNKEVHSDSQQSTFFFLFRKIISHCHKKFITILADSPKRITVFALYKKKKRGNLYLSLVPLFEAFALPIRRNEQRRSPR